MIFRVLTSLTRTWKRRILLTLDAVNSLVAFYLSWALLVGHLPSSSEVLAAIRFPLTLLPATVVLTMVMGLHRVKLNAYEQSSMIGTTALAVSLGLVGALVNLLPGPALPDATFVVLSMAFAILSVGLRLTLRFFVQQLYLWNAERKRVLIYGAGQTGQQLADALRKDRTFIPVCFVDESPNMHGLTIGGLKVHPPTRLMDLVEGESIDRIVLAMPSASPATRTLILRRLQNTGCRVQSLPPISELLLDARPMQDSAPLRASEFLGRDAFTDAPPAVNGTYHGRSILVTGAGGSIGAELCRQLLRASPARLIMLDHSEFALYGVDRELQALDPDKCITPVLGSVMDRALMQRIMREHSINVVLHAAAYKHVPMVEMNSAVGLANNVLGTRVVAEAADAAGAERFILISSDKAVRPTSVMGASKRMAELVVQELAMRSERTRFSMVRFGNVLGSSGSILPLFREQINAGGPVTVTDRRATRFFMTIHEAVSLVLLAGTFARGGEVFVLDMGKPILIQDLAEKMIRNAGLTVRDANNPDGDIEIVEIGLRPGEKLHEELLIGSDMLTTPHPKILRAQEDCLDSAAVADLLTVLQDAISQQDDVALRSVIARWIGQEQRGHIRVAEGGANSASSRQYG